MLIGDIPVAFHLAIPNNDRSKGAALSAPYVLKSFLNSYLHISVHRSSLSPTASIRNVATGTHAAGGWLRPPRPPCRKTTPPPPSEGRDVVAARRVVMPCPDQAPTAFAIPAISALPAVAQYRLNLGSPGSGER